MRGLIKEQPIILKTSWHLLISHQIMKYLFEPEAVVSFLVYSTKFIQQSFIECFSVPGPRLGAGDTWSPQRLSVETPRSAGRGVGWTAVLTSGGEVAEPGLKEGEGLPRWEEWLTR